MCVMNCKVHFGGMGFEEHSRSDRDSEREVLLYSCGMVPGLIISDRMWLLAQLDTASSFFFVGLMRCS